jgi:hypothetical protein
VSNTFFECGRIAAMTAGPNEMFGTKCPSITSRWIQSAPAGIDRAHFLADLAKSEASMDGAISSGRIDFSR